MIHSASWGSIDKRCEDRQRKLDGLERYRFRVVIEIPPVFLQLALLLYTSSPALFLWPLNRLVAWVVIGLILFVALSYGTIFIRGGQNDLAHAACMVLVHLSAKQHDVTLQPLSQF